MSIVAISLSGGRHGSWPRGNDNNQRQVYGLPKVELSWEYRDSKSAGIEPDGITWATSDRSSRSGFYAALYENPNPEKYREMVASPAGRVDLYDGMEWAFHTGMERTGITGGQFW